MTTRKRKSPNGRRTKKAPSLSSRILAGTGSAVANGAAGAGRGIAGAILRNPKPTLYATTFLVAFSFVAANALWYQPGGHPSPFLATRDAGDPNAIAGYRPFRQVDPDNVTTFRIERVPAGGQQPPRPDGETRTAAIPARSQGQPQAQPQAQPQGQYPAQSAEPVDDIRSIIVGQPGSASQSAGEDRALVAGIQRELSRRGLYDGADDGLMGPRTQAAILSFEQRSGLPQRGTPTPELLAALQQPTQQSAPAAGSLPTPIPRQAPRSETPRSQLPRAQVQRAQPSATEPQRVASRPSDQPARIQPANIQPVSIQPVSIQPAVQRVSAPARGEDPVTAAIRAAERQPAMTPPSNIPGATRAASTPAPRRAAATAPGPGSAVQATQMVLQIQKGLTNIAYTDVEVDGVAGSQTKAAIRRFQKHYRLAETGEPDEAVLKKLKAIGAL